jgi:hypothetical protein
MTLTTAPELTTLGDLAFEWRLVATAPLGEGPEWHGDLASVAIRRRYHEMVVANAIVTVTHRTPTHARIFAKLATVQEDEPRPIQEPPPPPTSDITPQKRRGRGYQGVFAVPPELRPRNGLNRGWAPSSDDGEGA